MLTRMNKDVPYERQMLLILQDYDKKIREIEELKEKVAEMADAVEVLGGMDAAKSIKQKCNNLKEKNKSLEAKLKTKTEAWETERKEKTRYKKQANILASALNACYSKLLDLLGMVEVPALRKMINNISVVLSRYKKVANELQPEDFDE